MSKYLELFSSEIGRITSGVFGFFNLSPRILHDVAPCLAARSNAAPSAEKILPRCPCGCIRRFLRKESFTIGGSDCPDMIHPSRERTSRSTPFGLIVTVSRVLMLRDESETTLRISRGDMPDRSPPCIFFRVEGSQELHCFCFRSRTRAPRVSLTGFVYVEEVIYSDVSWRGTLYTVLSVKRR